VEAAFTSAVSQFANNPAANGRALRELLNSDPDEFFRNAIPLLKRLQEEPGPTYVLVLLLSHGLLISDLLRDGLFSSEELAAIARQLSKVDPQFGVKLLKSVLPDSQESGPAELATVNMRLRVMDILESVSEGQRILPLLMRLLRDPDARVRSKAALLVGRTARNARWAEECLVEGDSRVRANAVESLWDVDSEGVRALLWNTLSDPDNRVIGNALLGLYRLGETAVIEHILRLARDSRDLYRATAAWVMGRTGDARFQPTLVNLIRDSAQVRANAFRALSTINQTKSRLAQSPVLRVSGWRNPPVEGWEEIQIALALEPELDDSLNAQTALVSGVRPTEFILYRDSALVVNYEVTEMIGTGPLSLGFLMPCSGSADSLHESLVQALKAASACRRKMDRWLIGRYNSTPARQKEQIIWSGNGPLHLKTEDQPGVAPPPPAPDPVFSSASRQIDEALQAAPAANLPNPIQCLQAAIRVSQNCKSPHFVLMIPNNPETFSADFCAEATRAASVLKATFHAISLSPSVPFDPGIQSLCQKSGGACLHSTADQLPQLLADLSAHLIGSYRIRLDAGPGSLKVQVQSERGCGSLVLAEFA